AAELGLQSGGQVDRAVFEPLYGHHQDPRDPSGQAVLGRAPRRFRSAEEIYAAMLAAEPEATAERRAQLMSEAKAQVRTPDLYWDATFSVSKSVSLFHASALANAAAAAERGDRQAAEAWEQVADGIWDAIMEGNAAALGYLQQEAGQTRAGYHPGGRWEGHRLVRPARRPRGGPTAPRAHPDPAQGPPRARRGGAGTGLDVAVPAPPRRVGDRHLRDGERADPPVRGVVGAAPGRARPG